MTNKEIVSRSSVISSIREKSKSTVIPVRLKLAVERNNKKIDSVADPINSTISDTLKDYFSAYGDIIKKFSTGEQDSKSMMLFGCIPMPMYKVSDDSLKDYSDAMEKLGEDHKVALDSISEMLDKECHEAPELEPFHGEDFNEATYFYIDPFMDMNLIEV